MFCLSAHTLSTLNAVFGLVGRWGEWKMCGLLWTTLIGFYKAPASFSSLSHAAVNLPKLYLLSHHQTADLLFSTIYTQDRGVGVKALMPPAQLQPLHVMYNHCPCVARQPQPPWPPCVICVLWCSWHRHLTRIRTQNLAKTQAVLHMDLNLLVFFLVCLGRRLIISDQHE